MDSFFTVSKVGWLLAAPSNLLMFVLLLGFLLRVADVRRPAFALVALSALGLLVCGFSPLANHLVSPLEERFPPFKADGRPVEGIILLGGSEVPDVALARGVPALNDAGERMLAFAMLARTYPDARLAFSGGSADLDTDGQMEADAVRLALGDLGVDLSRVTFERRSRNTAENAAFTRQLIQPQPGERWLLVTSAFHMPRAVGCFRQVGFPVTAYPVDYRTISPKALDGPFPRIAMGLDLTDLAAKEWLGLLAYYLSGRIPVLFPAPDAAAN
ncbi:membrane protein [Azorhizobium oxalatiphilum]|uniref:Membrane protein n=1 Tax=Azorhizobium oxalatiphilum TaxID=980631 RepID=A0A917BTR5_9HYPH|nr:YdcF family protein [Azorhizobium oxalatiphilum]GGF55581.1 membrane protein [Azorhizobium oxalatiphilum]